MSSGGDLVTKLLKAKLILVSISLCFTFAQEEGLVAYRILDVEGKAFYRDISWSQGQFKPLVRGEKLPIGNRFYIEVQNIPTKVIVACADLSNPRNIELYYSGTTFNWCTQENVKPQVVWQRFGAAKPFGLTPNILEPRATKLLNEFPTFRWQAVIEADSYTVILKDIYGNEVWRETTDRTQLTYWDGLLEGAEYYLEVVVRAGTKEHTSEESGNEIAFGLLSSTEKQLVESRELALINTPLSTLAYDYALAQLYMYYDLNLSALQRLEPYDTWKNPQNDPVNDFAIQYTLGELYARTKQIEGAWYFLNKALEIAQVTGNSINEQKVRELLDDE